MKTKSSILIGVFMTFLLFQACSAKHKQSIDEQKNLSKYEELFKDDGNLIPINSAEIQRQLGE
ncbi:hypothetical protein CQA38_08355 [Campylobacter sp. MIT 12-5580]|nr:hypothetical protein CQA38_08355 [Campylobacter sp. MIT 12-5580]